ncbi:hypothetical protein AVEN_48692-1 [Araneus ventricosus]|uniref:Uncharacterized protein n=1 Tax=Araneus ventricosus TaxID=182803 RepID=A0A4Y2FXC4_ARAVE|nr:hypothetical protein AVEN_48692-1 [Araneus ventricosus]
MHFSAFIVFQIVLAIGFHSVQAGDGKMDKLRKVMCDEEYEDMKNEIMSCAEAVNFSEEDEIREKGEPIEQCLEEKFGSKERRK